MSDNRPVSRRNIRHTIRFTPEEDALLATLAAASGRTVTDYIRLSSLAKRTRCKRAPLAPEQEQACRLVVWVAQQLEDFVVQTGSVISDDAQAGQLHVLMLTVSRVIGEFAHGRVRFIAGEPPPSPADSLS